MNAAHGLIIGKFYPPHAGHHLLVRTASAVCDRVTVVVMASQRESIPLDVRVRWMCDVHACETNVTVVGTMDEHHMDLDDPDVWAAHVALMKEATIAVTTEPVHAVFTSEKYGDELARRFNARHVCLDLTRELTPVSGTAIRSDPVRHWDYMAPPVRAWFTRPVVIVAAESTGKSTLSIELAQALRNRGGAFGRTMSIEEYGREYALQKYCSTVATAALGGRQLPAVEEMQWESKDFVAIARAQTEREDEAAPLGGPILVCDTDAFATGIWHERYLKCRSPEVESIAAARPAPLYLLTHHDDIPFIQDGTRDGEVIRGWMTQRFETRLREAGHSFVWLRGSHEARLRRAIQAVDRTLQHGWRLATPISGA